MVKPAAQALSPRQRGFTLMELMIVLLIVSICVGMAIPSFRDFMRNTRLTSGANDLLAGLNLARTEAIKRQIPMPGGVAICATTAPNAATPVCSGDWTTGSSSAWVVWVDTNGNWVPDTVNEPVLMRHEKLEDSVSIQADNNGVVKYVLTGFAAEPGIKTPTRNMVLCDIRGTATSAGYSKGRALLIANTGRARVSKLPADMTYALTATGPCP